VQRLPLQRVGVLELIDQQVADARVQPLLHPAERIGSASMTSAVRSTSFMSTQPRCALDGPNSSNQAARQPGHALLVLPGGVLAAGGEQALQLGLGLLRGGELLQVLGQPVFLGHEHGLAQHVAGAGSGRSRPARR
jgi:hypothetical protein